MAENEPTPRQTLAIFLGASSFQSAPKLAQGRAFYNSAKDFQEYLTDLEGLDLPSENVNWLFDDTRSPSDQLHDIGTFIEKRSRDLESYSTPPHDLILYYVGHGLFGEPNQTYCLAIRTTDEKNETLSSIRVSDLAHVIKARARFLRKLLILDCCFSAVAYKEFQSGPLHAGRVKLMDEFPKRGTTLLCSASAEDVSLAPEGLERTMFSDALIMALREGHLSLGPRLCMNELGDLVKQHLKNAYPKNWIRPEVHSPDQREGNVADIPFFPNAACLTRRRQKIEKILNGVEVFVQKKDFAGAISILDKVCKEYPDSIEVRKKRDSIATKLAHTPPEVNSYPPAEVEISNECPVSNSREKETIGLSWFRHIYFYGGLIAVLAAFALFSIYNEKLNAGQGFVLISIIVVLGMVLTSFGFSRFQTILKDIKIFGGKNKVSETVVPFITLLTTLITFSATIYEISTDAEEATPSISKSTSNKPTPSPPAQKLDFRQEVKVHVDEPGICPDDLKRNLKISLISGDRKEEIQPISVSDCKATFVFPSSAKNSSATIIYNDSGYSIPESKRKYLLNGTTINVQLVAPVFDQTVSVHLNGRCPVLEQGATVSLKIPGDQQPIVPKNLNDCKALFEGLPIRLKNQNARFSVSAKSYKVRHPSTTYPLGDDIEITLVKKSSKIRRRKCRHPTEPITCNCGEVGCTNEPYRNQ